MNNRRFGWRQALLEEEVTRIWNELYRMVYVHPLIQSARNSVLLGLNEYNGQAYTDLTQELFLTLFQKGRFEHYIDTNMSDSEIDHEISQIELTNLLVAHLRRHHPESYRIARRISTIIQSNERFKRFDTMMVREGSNARRRGLTEKVFGLCEWDNSKVIKERAMMEDLVQQVPVRTRDTREAGCTPNSQIIISNAELLKLIVEVYEAVDSLTDIKTIRNLVMSRLPVINIHMVPISKPEDDDSGSGIEFDIPDDRENPEDVCLNHEFTTNAFELADQFLDQLMESVQRKPKQSQRVLKILWNCYLESNRISNVKLAQKLGVSDSLISEYCHRINRHLRTLNLTIDQARVFEAALKKQTANKLNPVNLEEAA